MEYDIRPIIELLLLIMIANGTPVIISYLLRNRLALALDFGFTLADNRRCLGPNKTWRGVVTSLIITSLAAAVLGYAFETGMAVAALAMAGDLFSSFIKRRLGKPSGSQFVVLDQVPESLLPAGLLMTQFSLDMLQVTVVVIMFVILDQLLSVVFFKLGVRKHPY